MVSGSVEPTASDHLKWTTWPQRGTPKDSPRDAWRRAHDLDITHASHGRARVPSHDEARYDPNTQTVLFRRDSVLTTCYDLQNVTNDAGVAVRDAVEAQYSGLLDQ